MFRINLNITYFIKKCHLYGIHPEKIDTTLYKRTLCISKGFKYELKCIGTDKLCVLYWGLYRSTLYQKVSLYKCLYKLKPQLNSNDIVLQLMISAVCKKTCWQSL
jgi:hypothetical protein